MKVFKVASDPNSSFNQFLTSELEGEEQREFLNTFARDQSPYESSLHPTAILSGQRISQYPPNPLFMHPIQAKMILGGANDKYEQEADRVAKQVVNRIHSSTLKQSLPTQSLSGSMGGDRDKQPNLTDIGGGKGLIQRQLAKSEVPYKKSDLLWLRDTDEIDSTIYVDPLSLNYYRKRGDQFEKDEGYSDSYKTNAGDNEFLRGIHSEFIAQSVSKLHKNEDISEAKDLNYDDIAALSEMSEGENELAVPKSINAKEGDIAGSTAAGPCVIVLVKAISNKGRVFLGSIHLAANDMRYSVNATKVGIRGLMSDLQGKMDNGESMLSHEGFVIGGTKSKFRQDLQDYTHLLLAIQEMGEEFNLVGAKMPINEKKQYIDAYIYPEGLVEYEQFETDDQYYISEFEDDDESDIEISENQGRKRSRKHDDLDQQINEVKRIRWETEEKKD